MRERKGGRENPAVPAKRAIDKESERGCRVQGAGCRVGVECRVHLTQCINHVVSLKSIYPQTLQLNFITRNSKESVDDFVGEWT